MKKLPTGTKNTGLRFSATDICRIITVCEKSRVSRLKLGDLFLSFEPTGLQSHVDQPKTPDLPSDVTTDTEPVVHELQNTHAKESREDERISQLMVDDPQGFEQEIIDGFLEDEDAGNGRDEFDEEDGSGSQPYI